MFCLVVVGEREFLDMCRGNLAFQGRGLIRGRWSGEGLLDLALVVLSWICCSSVFDSGGQILEVSWGSGGGGGEYLGDP